MSEEQVQEFKVQPNYSVESSLLIAKLNKGEIGDILTDEELTEIARIPCNVGGKGYGYLQTAIRYCERQPPGERRVWKRVKGNNMIKCLDSDEIINHATGGMRGIHRRGKRIARQVTAIDLPTLENGKKSEALALISQAATLASFAHGRTTKMLRDKNVKKKIDMKLLVDAMK